MIKIIILYVQTDVRMSKFFAALLIVLVIPTKLFSSLYKFLDASTKSFLSSYHKCNSYVDYV